jgi:hypothetical protein
MRTLRGGGTNPALPGWEHRAPDLIRGLGQNQHEVPDQGRDGGRAGGGLNTALLLRHQDFPLADMVGG